MARTIILILLFFSVISSFAQKRYTISGTNKDEATGELLIGATVKIKELPQIGTSTNSYGFYSFSAPDGEYTLLFTYVGYETLERQVLLHQSQTVNISISPGNSLKEVVISSNKPNNDNVASPQMGLEKLNMSQINQVPVLLGERDILKTISLLPGIKSAGEGNTGFYVRGGASDQNLILLDEAPVYNASHFFGFFSTFNSDAIKDVSIYKGGMPAEYGGRLSSVLDIKMNDGNNKDFTVQGGLGLIASRIKVEGPLVKDKGSFMISARRTYLDLFLKASSDSTIKGSSLYFYDINAKANYHFDDKNALYLSGYFGKDVLSLKNTFGTNWGNSTGTIRFNHIFNNRLFSNTSLIYSNYNYTIQSLQSTDNFKATSKITDLNLKEDLQYAMGNDHTLKFGLNVLHHTIAPGDITTTATSSFNSRSIEQRYGFENAAYVSDEWKANDKLTILYGLRLSGMFLLGPGTFSTYNALGNTVSSITYSSGQSVKTYFNLEPRFSASYQLNDDNSIKISYNRNTQNIHLLTNSTSSSPTDLYVMSSNNIKPEIADQVSTGWFRNFKDNTYEFSAEVYYKKLQNQIDYKDGAQLIANQDVESQLTYGSGRAYGLELFLKKKYGRFNGWIGYTLSRTELKFDAINNGNYYPARQDRTHDLSVVGIYQLSKRWSFSGTFIYGTGNAVTYPTGKYNIGGLTTFSYSQRNGYRLPSSNRLDIGATLEGKEHKKYQSSWTFGIYNIYGHRDPYLVTFRDSKTVPNTTEAVETSIFATPIPSVTWNFKF
ncbi:MAG: TonB-dependent receptor [Mucilaginibacter sp.]|nr:TonB-dependent receptor [Mucilaginibacter sp.]